LKIKFDNSYARDLAGMYVPWHVSGAPKPELVWLNEPLSADLGLNPADLRSAEGLEMLSGVKEPEGAQAIAQAYAGHQFGHFSPQLGDGRALLLGEVLDRQGQRRDIAFKGSGRTPFSRGGDGKATVSSVLREVLISESMHALGIPTTRSLAAVATGETILREHAAPAGILTRVAASHLRVGSFEFFAARGDVDSLRRLADYAIARHDPSLIEAPDRYLLLLQHVMDRQARLIAQWMGVGFIHGVMNTDNMTISGETIDYGPCAFMEAYTPNAVFSSIDTQGRYAYANQPSIAKWNLSRLASALLPLIDPELERAKVLATDAVNTFDALFAKYSLAVWRAKLGMGSTGVDDEGLDERLANDFLQLMQNSNVDFTQGWRSLVAAAQNNEQTVRTLFGVSEALDNWLQEWRHRLAAQSGDPAERLTSMKRANPIHIARNHLVEQALDEATMRQDWQPFEALMAAITQPFEAGTIDSKFATPAPAEVTACYRTFCGT
jgi:serine/tyrosine/threonine adenylyltransferase